MWSFQDFINFTRLLEVLTTLFCFICPNGKDDDSFVLENLDCTLDDTSFLVMLLFAYAHVIPTLGSNCCNCCFSLTIW